jgi:hypothetical protein
MIRLKDAGDGRHRARKLADRIRVIVAETLESG